MMHQTVPVLKDLWPSWAFMEPELALTLGYVGWDL